MRIFVACELSDAALQQLRALGSEVDYRPDCPAGELAEAITDVGILVVGSQRVAGDVIERGQILQMIVRAGEGVGDIALEDASGQGVFVMHCPNRHADAVAELVMGLVVALDRRIVEHTLALRDGQWHPGKYAARGLAGRTLGILGYAGLGQRVAELAQAYRMHVVGWMPTLAGEFHEPDDGVEFCSYPRELARLSDVVVLLPFEGDATRIVDGSFLECLAPGATLVHLGDAGAIDEDALRLAIEQRQLRVGIDIFDSEPVGESGRFRCDLLSAPGVVATPHLGALTAQAREATAAEVVRIIRAFLITGELVNCLNLMDRSPATWQLVLRVKDQVGVMASILDAIRADGINAEEITSRVFKGAKAAWCTIALDERPSREAVDAIRGLGDVLHLELRAVV